MASCAGLLSRVDGARLDCVSDDLALLLADRGVADVTGPFARDWRFDLIEGDGPPRVDLPPRDQDELLARRTGWRPRWRAITSVAGELPRLRRALGDRTPVLLVGDAYHLPWLPYAGHQHMDHGFVLEGLEPGDDDPLAHIVDPYENATEWGRAEPIATRLRLSAFATALPGGRWAVLVPAETVPEPGPAAQIAANATAILAADERGAYRRFAERHRGQELAELENLTLQSWLLTRNRDLHSRWLGGLPASVVDASLADRFAAEVVGGWKRVTETSYMAMRRVRSGRRAPTATLAALASAAAAEVDLARSLAQGGSPL